MENAMTDNNEWKNKVQELLGQFQEEVKKTTQIGMKMLCASYFLNNCIICYNWNIEKYINIKS